MLYDPAAHEPLVETPWDPDRAHAAIERIVRDTEAHLSAETWWPVHPRDIEPTDAEGVASTTLYFGAAGVIWALEHLRRHGAAQLAANPSSGLDRLVEDNRAWLNANGYGDELASYLMGDTPIEMMAFGLAPTPERGDRLAQLIAGNHANPARELLWGAPGTMLAALHLHERTGDARWADLFRESAAALWAQVALPDGAGVRHWRHDLHGLDRAYMGAGHGFAGNVAAVVRGRELLDRDTWEGWQSLIVEGSPAWRDAKGTWPTGPCMSCGQQMPRTRC